MKQFQFFDFTPIVPDAQKGPAKYLHPFVDIVCMSSFIQRTPCSSDVSFGMWGLPDAYGLASKFLPLMTGQEINTLMIKGNESPVCLNLWNVEGFT